MTLYNKYYLGAETTAATTIDAVSLDQVRDFLRVDEDVCDNGLLTLIRDAATSAVANYTNRSLLSSTMVAYYSNFDTTMPLPGGYVSAISTVKYRDSNNTLQTVSSSDYLLINDSKKTPYLWIDPDYTTPTLGDYPRKIEVTYTAGYASADDLPKPITLCILNLCADFYDDRSLLMSKSVPDKLKFALYPYKVHNF